VRAIPKLFLALLTLLIPAAVYLLTWPVEIDPVAWTPPPAPPLEGVYAPNTYLDEVERILDGQFTGPEDIAMDAEGRLYTGVVDGRIVRCNTDGTGVITFADTKGRPLGLAWDAAGNLIVADALRGLLSIDPGGSVSTLVTECDGIPLGFTDDVDIARDGTIYFTDASWRYHVPNYMADLMDGRGNGRFLAYDPASRKTRTLIGDLAFANGVALSPDESFVLVNETWRYRVLRYWLTGDKQGTWDVFIDNLPGFPDNISSNGDGAFWLALFTTRNPMADTLAPYPLLRRVLWRLPKSIMPKAKPYSFVLGLDTNGQVIHNLQGPTGIVAPVTSVNEFNGTLYLGSVEDSAVGRIAAP
jgi:YD repeat-containing protein